MRVMESWTDYGRGYEDGQEKTIDRVLEIIDEVIGGDVEYAKDLNDETWKKCVKRSIDIALDIRDSVKALKGGEQG